MLSADGRRAPHGTAGYHHYRESDLLLWVRLTVTQEGMYWLIERRYPFGWLSYNQIEPFAQAERHVFVTTLERSMSCLPAGRRRLEVVVGRRWGIWDGIADGSEDAVD